jgi:ferredoxin
MIVNLKGEVRPVPEWLKRKRESFVELCERCGAVCSSACRSNALLGRARDRATALRGGRV